jgi:hypothetical protein
VVTRAEAQEIIERFRGSERQSPGQPVAVIVVWFGWWYLDTGSD